MRTRRIKFEKQVVMALISILLFGSGCEDRIDTRGNSSVGEGTPVDVALRIGLADETDAYTLSAAPESKAPASTSVVPAFDYALCPSAGTKAATTLKPTALYNLEIRQYRNSDGVCIGGSGTVAEEEATGSLITATLQTATKCHLVLVVWGKGNTTNRLGTVTLSKAQEMSVLSSYITVLDPAKQDDMDKMPYMLHLEDVNVSDDGRIYSADGEAIDVRLLLRRLAARLTVDWTYNVQISGSTYKPSRILLQSIPSNYNVIPAPDASSGNTYPSLLDQFTTVQLKEAEIVSGGYSCWLPANVRGTSPEATSLFYRYKKNAPVGSSFIEFQATNQSNAKQKLNYRVYLGENTSTDFNLHANTDYKYTVNIKHTELPNNDLRVTIIDPIAASENNSNFVPTANCFMIAPGGSFCFNPYKYYQDGQVINNVQLMQAWHTTPSINSVRVFWQTKEDGDVGDPVLGTVNKADDHTNIVDLTNSDSFENARIYCRVAPNTKGGSGSIVAYSGADGTGTIVWSWHIWVTDYNPDETGSETVLTPVNKRKLKFTYNVDAGQLPMMDRNLGAMAGFTLSAPPETMLDMSKSNGLHYQWGRKDPFPSSYSAVKVSIIKGLTSETVPPKGMLNRYGPDGITYQPLKSDPHKTTIRNACQNPGTFFILSSNAIDWCSETSNIPTLWNSPNADTGKKTFYDPCPAGWRVISYKNLYSFFTGTPSSTDGTITGNPNIANTSTLDDDGGAYLYYSANGSGDATYLRMTGYWRFLDEFQFVGEKSILWIREHTGTTGKSNYGFSFLLDGKIGIEKTWYPQDAQTTRCIQEKVN